MYVIWSSAEKHVVVTLRTSTLTGVGRFREPVVVPTVHTPWLKVPAKGGAVNVICVGVLVVGKTFIPFTTTRMLLSMKLPPVITTPGAPASGTLDGEMLVMNGLRLFT